MIYEREPSRIYELSFQTVRSEAQLGRFSPDTAELVVRLIHACGMTDIANDIVYTPDCVEAGRQALAAGAAILCDVEMVASGIIRRGAAARANIVSTINNPQTAKIAERIGNTRSAAAVELWREQLDGSVVAIGNAPTTLFHLLELLDQGWPKPAAILAFPVGFVGAAESKAELAANPRGVPFITLTGRRGGSAMASAAVNALSLGLAGDGR
ncbi:MAG: precorrin-8X methylmutase [Pseudomonadota bacterium]